MQTEWIKAKRSSNNNGCVELRETETGIEMRNSREPNGKILNFTKLELEMFVGGARDGDFDHMI